MLGQLLKYYARRFHPSYLAFQQAKEIYDRHAENIGLKLLGPTQEQQDQAQNEGRLEKAEELYQQALRLCLKDGEDYNAGVVRFQLGLLKRLQGRFAEAIPWLEQALLSFQQAVRARQNARASVSVCLFYLGQAYLKVGQTQLAHQHLERAIVIDEAMQAAERSEAARHLLAQCAEQGSAEEEQNLSSASPGAQGNAQTSNLEEHEIDESPLPISPPATIWVVSQTNAAKQSAVGIVTQALAGLSNQPEIISTALEGIDLDRHPVGALRNDSRLSSVVLIIEPSSLSDRSFLSLVQWSIAQVAARDEFRLFLWLYGMTTVDFERAAASGNETLKTLIDTVQTEHTGAPDALQRSLRAYLARLQETRNAGAWLRFRLAASVWLGYFATVLQVLCVPPGITLIFWLPVWNTRATLRQFAGEEPWAALICGVASFPFLMMGLFAYTRYGLFLFKMRQDPLGPVWGSAFTFLGVPVILSAFRIKAPLAWIILGLVSGAMLDAARRIGLRAERERRPVEPRFVARKHGRLPKRLREQAGSSWLNPLRCPLFPVRTPKVFISYTRSSTWANRVARALIKHLSEIGVKAFLDQSDIPAGANWRRFLNHHLGRSTAFICLVDAQSVEREWPAAEMEAALAGKHLTGLPQIIVVKDPHLPYASKKTWSWLPAFRELVKMNEQPASEGQPLVVQYSESEPSAIAYAFHPDAFKSVSVLPARLADFLRGAWNIVSVPLLFLTAAGGIVGHLAIMLVLAELIWRINSARWLGTIGLLPVVYLLCAFWVGSLARLALAARFHLRHGRAIGAFKAHRDAAIILTVLLVIWGIGSPALLIGWALVTCVAGWAVADGFYARESRKDPNFLQPEDW